jgi:MFS family permease
MSFTTVATASERLPTDSYDLDYSHHHQEHHEPDQSPVHSVEAFHPASQDVSPTHSAVESNSSRGARPSHFRGPGHEIAFIAVVVMSQLFTQMNLGNTIIQSRTLTTAFGIADSPAQESWFVASYSTTVGAFVLVTGRLGDIHGIKTLYMLGWVWFALLALLCGFCSYARDHGSRAAMLFDVLRALMGIGPATLMPNASALFGNAWRPGTRKNAAFAVLGAVAPGGFVLGLLWGALFAQLAHDWRWTFWGMSILCSAMAGLSWWIIPKELNVSHGGKVDWLGSGVGVSALVLIFFAFKYVLWSDVFSTCTTC